MIFLLKLKKCFAQLFFVSDFEFNGREISQCKAIGTNDVLIRFQSFFKKNEMHLILFIAFP